MPNYQEDIQLSSLIVKERDNYLFVSEDDLIPFNQK